MVQEGGHSPNEGWFKRVDTVLTKDPSRVDTALTKDGSRVDTVLTKDGSRVDTVLNKDGSRGWTQSLTRMDQRWT